jgi:hypothetical protein
MNPVTSLPVRPRPRLVSAAPAVAVKNEFVQTLGRRADQRAGRLFRRPDGRLSLGRRLRWPVDQLVRPADHLRPSPGPDGLLDRERSEPEPHRAERRRRPSSSAGPPPPRSRRGAVRRYYVARPEKLNDKAWNGNRTDCKDWLEPLPRPGPDGPDARPDRDRSRAWPGLLPWQEGPGGQRPAEQRRGPRRRPVRLVEHTIIARTRRRASTQGPARRDPARQHRVRRLQDDAERPLEA